MKPNIHLRTVAAAALAAAGTSVAQAETFSITVISGHPPVNAGVAGVRDFFIPEVDRRLAEAGDYTIDWTEAYGGSVADVRGVLEAVELGIGDMGYVPHLFEGDKLPLEQITYMTPFSTGDLPALMQVITRLHEEIPEMGAAWRENNQMVLAPVGIDDYQIISDFPIESLDDIAGRRLGTAGLALNWLRGTDAIPVSGALTDYYNSMSTDLIDGAITFESAVAAYNFHEVAPYVTKVGFGAKYASALTVNLDVWEGLPEEVRAVMREVADEYRTRTAETYLTSGQRSLDTAQEEGATVSELAPEERARLAEALPNIAREWADELDARGLPGTHTLETYLALSEEAGLTFARDWLAE